MKKSLNIQTIGSWASIIALVFFLYFQFVVVEKKILKIETINELELTKIPNVTHLESTFKYKNKMVNNLWQSYFFIENTGSKTIIGKGNNKDLINDYLSLKIDTTAKIISFKIIGWNFPIEHKRINDREYYLEFNQWRPGENIEIIALLEGSKEEKSIPKFTISEREIINGEVEMKTYQVNNNSHNEKLISKLSNGIQSTLWWSAVIFYIIVGIMVSYEQMKISKGAYLKTIFSLTIVFFFYLLPLLWMI